MSFCSFTVIILYSFYSHHMDLFLQACISQPLTTKLISFGLSLALYLLFIFITSFLIGVALNIQATLNIKKYQNKRLAPSASAFEEKIFLSVAIWIKSSPLNLFVNAVIVTPKLSFIWYKARQSVRSAPLIASMSK